MRRYCSPMYSVIVVVGDSLIVDYEITVAVIVTVLFSVIIDLNVNFPRFYSRYPPPSRMYK